MIDYPALAGDHAFMARLRPQASPATRLRAKAARWRAIAAVAAAGVALYFALAHWPQNLKDLDEAGGRNAEFATSPSTMPDGRGGEARKQVELQKLLEPGTRFRDCPECPELVVVPAGSFLMGSPPHEQGRFEDEGPVHQVRIDRPFAVGVYEVSVSEFGRFVEETGHRTGDSCYGWTGGEWQSRSGFGWRNPGFGQAGSHPVTCVSWQDARSYLDWLSRSTGEGYRLPSEAEWEYMARAGTRTARWWGESGQCSHENGGDGAVERRYSGWPWAVASCDDGHVHTAPVGSYRANAWGLHDVLGNVWEWTGDCWNANYAGAPSDGSAQEYGDCSLRVLRGGSWGSRPRFLRSAFRDRSLAGFRISICGFRVARTLTP